ncbi:MAG: YncE family protein [Candidatus Marsarchaeota archaeon]|jgi:YVTN family beta-propeller protein|nr:YncE family protein [Candidatus Marsarchaeota archaeon]
MKGQSAIEFISVYGFMLIIASLFIALIVLFAFSAQDSIQTSQCNGYSGFYCGSAQAVYNSVAKNSLIYIALDSEQSAPVNVIGINVVVSNSIYTGTCNPSVADPASRINCIVGINSITRDGQQIVGSYVINGEYCNSPLYNVTIKACEYQNVTYTGFFSTFVSNHLSIGYENNTVDANVVGAITAGISNPSGVSISPSSTYAYVTNEGSSNVVIINTVTNTVTGSISGSFEQPASVAISPTGTYAYVGNMYFGGYPNIDRIDTATNTVTGSFSTVGYNAGDPEGMTISPSGSTAWVGGTANVITVDTATNQITTTNIAVQIDLGGLAMSPNGAYVYLVNYYGNNVLLINTANKDISGSITYKDFLYPSGDAISPDGKYLYVANTGTNEVFIVDTTTSKVVDTLKNGFNIPTGIAFAHSGSFVYVTNSGSNNVVIINPGSYN